MTCTLAGQLPQQQQQQEVALAAGLSRALCYANRLLPRYGASTRHKAKPRILSLLAGADTPLQYIPVMNCIFAAQHAGVALDACILGAADSAFMQQAAHITGGQGCRLLTSYLTCSTQQVGARFSRTDKSFLWEGHSSRLLCNNHIMLQPGCVVVGLTLNLTVLRAQGTHLECGTALLQNLPVGFYRCCRVPSSRCVVMM
jgi:hypothetical protein